MDISLLLSTTKTQSHSHSHSHSSFNSSPLHVNACPTTTTTTTVTTSPIEHSFHSASSTTLDAATVKNKHTTLTMFTQPTDNFRERGRKQELASELKQEQQSMGDLPTTYFSQSLSLPSFSNLASAPLFPQQQPTNPNTSLHQQNQSIASKLMYQPTAATTTTVTTSSTSGAELNQLTLTSSTPSPTSSAPHPQYPKIKPAIHKPFRCTYPDCDATFGQKGSLTRHVRSRHERLRPHTCDICRKSFSALWTLRVHQRNVHLKSKPHKCHLCDKSFGELFNKSKHIAIVHEGKRPFSCPICSRAFGYKGDMRKHVLELHQQSGRPFQCIVPSCGVKFARKRYLRRHENLSHKGHPLLANRDRSPSPPVVPRSTQTPSSSQQLMQQQFPMLSASASACGSGQVSLPNQTPHAQTSSNCISDRTTTTTAAPIFPITHLPATHSNVTNRVLDERKVLPEAGVQELLLLGSTEHDQKPFQIQAQTGR